MKRLFVFLFTVTLAINVFSDDVDIQDVIDAGLPVLYVETVDGEEPTFDKVTHPEGMMGEGITNATKVPGRIRIVLGGADLYDSGDYVAKTSGMTIMIRGNTSAYANKKPYKIKLQQKADLLNRGDDAKYGDKNWILVKDESLLYKIGFKVNELVGLQWTPQYRYVNLVFNGEYRGLYMLLESVERNTECRLNVKKTGYIYELDAYWWNEDRYFNSSVSTKINYTYKYPDSDDVTEEQNDYIQGVVDAVEASMQDGTYNNYIDINSFASWMLGRDLLGNTDGAGSNQYFTKYDNTTASKVMMGNLWDFDAIMKSTSWDAAHISYYSFFRSLFNNVNKSFVRAYKEKWNTLKTSFFTDMEAYLDDFASSEEAIAFDKSILLDNARWGRSLTNVASRVETAKSWFTDREGWLETNIAEINDQEDTYNNTLAIVNAGTVEIAGVELNGGDSFTTTACSDVILKLKPGTNMTVTYLKIDNVDVTEDIVNYEYTIAHVLGKHKVEVRYDRTLVHMPTIYATYCSTANLDFTAVEGLDAYVAKIYDKENGMIILEKLDKAPAGTGLILVGTANEDYQIPIATSVSVISDNMLVGVNETATINPDDGSYQNYILANRTSGLGFYKLTDSGSLAAGKAYLQVPQLVNNARVLTFAFSNDNGTTGIKLVEEKTSATSDYYNLTGLRVKTLGKGIYIKNGKKVINR